MHLFWSLLGLTAYVFYLEHHVTKHSNVLLICRGAPADYPVGTTPFSSAQPAASSTANQQAAATRRSSMRRSNSMKRSRTVNLTALTRAKLDGRPDSAAAGTAAEPLGLRGKPPPSTPFGSPVIQLTFVADNASAANQVAHRRIHSLEDLRQVGPRKSILQDLNMEEGTGSNRQKKLERSFSTGAALGGRGSLARLRSHWGSTMRKSLGNITWGPSTVSNGGEGRSAGNGEGGEPPGLHGPHSVTISNEEAGTVADPLEVVLGKAGQHAPDIMKQRYRLMQLASGVLTVNQCKWRLGGWCGSCKHFCDYHNTVLDACWCPIDNKYQM